METTLINTTNDTAETIQLALDLLEADNLAIGELAQQAEDTDYEPDTDVVMNAIVLGYTFDDLREAA